MASPRASGDPRSALRTWANALTLLRLLLAPVLVHALLAGHDVLAAVCFASAVATDLADGRVARWRGEATSLGGFLDHVTDAAFVASGLGALAARGEVPWLLPPLVVAAFVQYASDSRALAGRPLRASRLGRWNGIAYYALLGTPVVSGVLALGWPGPEWVRVLGWCLVATTLASMLDRLLALRRPRR